VTQPLSELSVVVTRARHQAAELVDALHELGATVVECPLIEILPPSDGGSAVRDVFGRWAEYDWLLITSVNTVARWGEQLSAYSGHVAAIGPGTAQALIAVGLNVDLVPTEFVAESLVTEFPEGTGRVLLLNAEVARDVVPQGLRAKGWQVDVVAAYRTEPVRPTLELQHEIIDADVITFMASSAVRAYLDLGVKVPPFVACIGPVTAEAARQNGLNVNLVADEHTVAGLVNALVEAFRR
jgi:uroporphyrinogen-III synthase